MAETKTHELKIVPAYYEAVASGRKCFELRNNDRDFKVGDQVLLREWYPETESYTGRQIRVTISYVLTQMRGLYDGYCIFCWR